MLASWTIFGNLPKEHFQVAVLAVAQVEVLAVAEQPAVGVVPSEHFLEAQSEAVLGIYWVEVAMAEMAARQPVLLSKQECYNDQTDETDQFTGTARLIISASNASRLCPLTSAATLA